MTELKKPKVGAFAQAELDKAEKNFEEFDNSVKELTLDRMNSAPKQESEPQTKLSQNEIENSKRIYLKPKHTHASREKFNEDYRSEYEFAKEYVQFIAEHKELIGEIIEMWTKPFPGMPGEFWEVPTNRPVWAPRYVAEQISRKVHHKLVMKDATTENTGAGQFYGTMAVDTTIERLTARPVSTRKSIFMGV